MAIFLDIIFYYKERAFLYFEMLEFVEVLVYDNLVCMVQKYLVDNTRHHLMIISLYNRVFVV